MSRASRLNFTLAILVATQWNIPLSSALSPVIWRTPLGSSVYLWEEKTESKACKAGHDVTAGCIPIQARQAGSLHPSAEVPIPLRCQHPCRLGPCLPLHQFLFFLDTWASGLLLQGGKRKSFIFWCILEKWWFLLEGYKVDGSYLTCGKGLAVHLHVRTADTRVIMTWESSLISCSTVTTDKHQENPVLHTPHARSRTQILMTLKPQMHEKVCLK